MTQWWWVRHGPTVTGLLAGWSDLDVDLSDQSAVGHLARNLPTDAVMVSSDLRRASQTADAIGEGHHRLADTDSIREFNFGDWDGQNVEKIVQVDGDRLRAFWTDPENTRPPNGENWHDLCNRVNPFVDKLNSAHHGRNIIAVAHKGVILTQIQRVTRQSVRDLLREEIAHLSITRLTFSEDLWTLGRPVNSRTLP